MKAKKCTFFVRVVSFLAETQPRLEIKREQKALITRGAH
jgi:hypothetical protein